MNERRNPNIRRPVRCARGECKHARNKCPWEARYRDPDGRQRTRTFTQYADAKAFLSTVRTEIDSGQWVDPRAGRVTFDAFAPQVEATRVDRRPTTRARDRSLLDGRVLPHFTGRRLASITRMEVRAWVAGLEAAGLAPATVRKCFQLFAQVMDEAVEQRLIPASPCVRIPLPTAERSERPLLTPEHVLTLADTIEHRYRALVLTAAYTGLRWGELAALRVERVDLTARRLDVAETLTEVDGALSFGPPKTPKSRGLVPFPAALGVVLVEHLGIYTAPGGLVFTSGDGGPLRRSNFRRRVWAPAAARAGLPDGATFHDLRHACASWLIHAGASPLEVAEQLRHSRPTTTLGLYAHLFPGTDERVAGLLDATFQEAQDAADASPCGESVVRHLRAVP